MSENMRGWMIVVIALAFVIGLPCQGGGTVYVISASSSGQDLCAALQTAAYQQAQQLAGQQCFQGWQRKAARYSPNNADDTCPNSEGSNTMSVSLSFRCINP